MLPGCPVYTSSFGKQALASDKINFSRYHDDPITVVGDNIKSLCEEDKIELFPNEYLEVSIDTVESGGIRIACRAEHPCVIVLNERLFKLVNSYILDVLFGFHEKQKTLVVGNQSTVSAFRLSFAYLFFIRFNLFSEEYHKSMAFL